MATTQVRILVAAWGALVLAGCAKEPAGSPDGTATIRATIPASMQSKVSMTPSGGGLALAWQSGDVLRVVGEQSQLYTIQPGFSAHIADFSGTPVDGSGFTVYYPGQRYASVQDLRARSYASQLQDGNGSTAHLEWNALYENVSDYAHLDFSQARQNGVICWRIELPEDAAAPTAVALSADRVLFPQTNAEVPAKGQSWSLSLSHISLASDHVLYAWMMIPWTDVPLPEGTILSVSVRLSDGKEYSSSVSVPAGGLTIRSGRVNAFRLYKSEEVDHFDAGLEGFTWTPLVPYVPPTPPGPSGEDVSGSQEGVNWDELFPSVPAPSGNALDASQEAFVWNNIQFGL